MIAPMRARLEFSRVFLLTVSRLRLARPSLLAVLWDKEKHESL